MSDVGAEERDRKEAEQEGERRLHRLIITSLHFTISMYLNRWAQRHQLVRACGPKNDEAVH